MKSRKNRIVSLITAAFLLCSVIVPATRGGITARAAGFETESYTVDFKDFDLTNDGKAWSNGGWSIEDDSEAAGGKYLKFSDTNFDWNGRLAIRLIPNCKLKNSSNYRGRTPGSVLRLPMLTGAILPRAATLTLTALCL